MASFRIQRQSFLFDYKQEVFRLYRPFFENNVNIDVIPSHSTFDEYEVLLVPVINLVLLVVVSKLGILPVSFEGMATTVIMMAAPTATVAAAYAISYDREALFTSNCSLLSTVVAVVAMPVWIIALEVIKNIGLFA